MKYEIKSCVDVDPDVLKDFMYEFEEHGEFCNAMWRAYEVGVPKWQVETNAHVFSDKERCVAFLIDGALAGVARITPKPRHIENGKIGYYLRPSFRKKKYAPVFLRLIEDFCAARNINSPTAVTDIKNTSSIQALRCAGWVETGNRYLWTSEERDRIAVEFAPAKYDRSTFD